MPDYNIRKFIKFPLTASVHATVKCYNQCMDKYLESPDLDLDDIGFYAHMETLEDVFGLSISESLEETPIVVGKQGRIPYVLIPLEWGEKLSLTKMMRLKEKGATEIVSIAGDAAPKDAVPCYEYGNVKITPLV